MNKRLKKNKDKIIPAVKAVRIRKKIRKLKKQSVKLYHSVLTPKTEMDSLYAEFKNQLDSLNEMGDTESLRLQMAMDRISKMMSTLSNILKKINNTSDGILKNIK